MFRAGTQNKEQTKLDNNVDPYKEFLCPVRAIPELFGKGLNERMKLAFSECQQTI